MSHTNTFVWDLDCLVFFPPSVNNTDHRTMEAKRGLGKGEKDRRPPSERTEQKGGRRARTPQRGPGRVTGQSASRHLRALKRTGAPRAGLPEQHRFPPRPQIKPKRSTAPRSRSAEELDEAWRGFAAPLSWARPGPSRPRTRTRPSAPAASAPRRQRPPVARRTAALRGVPGVALRCCPAAFPSFPIPLNSLHSKAKLISSC